MFWCAANSPTPSLLLFISENKNILGKPHTSLSHPIILYARAPRSFKYHNITTSRFPPLSLTHTQRSAQPLFIGTYKTPLKHKTTSRRRQANLNGMDSLGTTSPSRAQPVSLPHQSSPSNSFRERDQPRILTNQVAWDPLSRLNF